MSIEEFRTHLKEHNFKSYPEFKKLIEMEKELDQSAKEELQKEQYRKEEISQCVAIKELRGIADNISQMFGGIEYQEKEFQGTKSIEVNMHFNRGTFRVTAFVKGESAWITNEWWRHYSNTIELEYQDSIEQLKLLRFKGEKYLNEKGFNLFRMFENCVMRRANYGYEGYNTNGLPRNKNYTGSNYFGRRF